VDEINESEAKAIKKIAQSSDHPLLMMNLNRYTKNAFANGNLYREWREINSEMIGNVGGKIIWSLPVEGFILSNGPSEELDEILAYWYPSHECFLEMRNSEIAKKNFELRQELVEYAIVHRCNGKNPPLLPAGN
jgi:hypothetical protein